MAPEHHASAFARYGNWLQKRPRLTGAFALLVMLVIAIPMLSLRLGFSDDGGTPQGTPSRIAYDLTAEGFGPGVNGPFYIAVQLPQPGDQASVTALTDALSQDPGVALAAAPPVAADATVVPIQVYPTTAPQDVATTDLLNHLRQDVIPTAVADTGAQAYVGGFQAVTVDFTKVLADALPWFLLIVVGLGFLALVVLFRSILVPATGVLSSLLSLAAAMGITVAVFQWGWFGDQIDLQATGPIFPFLPVMVFSILFGLSCDYQVFLVSRMHEEWLNTPDNRRAVRRGLAGSGRVVAIAAAIMTSVFAAFILGNDPIIKLFGVALSTAVLLDAFIVRLILIPSLMTIFGKANWWLPGWLDKVLPHVSIESDEDIAAGSSEIEDISDPDDDIRMMPVWAKEIGVPICFSAPVRISVEDNQMTQIEGGPEATAIRGFLEALARRIGEKNAFEIRGPHGGVHPHAIVSHEQCPDEDYREFIASFHTAAVHMHLGQAGKSASFPFNLHTAAEARGATFKIGSHVLHERGRLAVADEPRVKAVAARYAGRPGIQ